MLKILINYKKSLKNGREELKEYAIGETISKMTYLDQLVFMKRSKLGSTSENASLIQWNRKDT